MNDDAPERHWHIDRRVPIALLGALVLQTGAAFWWASSISSRVDYLERQMQTMAPQADRLTRVEVRMESVLSGIERIERMIRGRPVTVEP